MYQQPTSTTGKTQRVTQTSTERPVAMDAADTDITPRLAPLDNVADLLESVMPRSSETTMLVDGNAQRSIRQPDDDFEGSVTDSPIDQYGTSRRNSNTRSIGSNSYTVSTKYRLVHMVMGMDGQILRGRDIDEILKHQYFSLPPARRPKGLPPVPQQIHDYGSNTLVVVRIRPQTALEIREGGVYCLETAEDDEQSVTVATFNGVNRDTTYSLHKIMGPDTTQEEIYNTVAHPIVEGVLYGYNGTIFAYGQTSSGKTYTTFGAHEDNAGPQDEVTEGLGSEEHKGIIPRAVETIFSSLRTLPPDVKIDVSISMVEIYQDRIRDLLARRQGSMSPTRGSFAFPLAASPSTNAAAATTLNTNTPPGLNGRSISPRRPKHHDFPASQSVQPPLIPSRSVSPRRYPGSPTSPLNRSPGATVAAPMYGEEDSCNLSVVVDSTFGAQVCGALALRVASESEVLDVLRTGAKNRAIAATSMNESSSRSHCIVTLTILQESPYGEPSANAGAPAEDAAQPVVRYSKLYFVDLAGSERPAKSRVVGVQLQEAQAINSSLSTLGTVINALANGQPHIPYRDSKLTRVLQDGLGNNSRTALIINVSPSSYNAEETKSSLRFGATAIRIRNKVAHNILSPQQREKIAALGRLQRARSYSAFVRDSQKSEQLAKLLEKERRQSLAKQKMRHLRLTNPDDALATHAPSNVVVPETSPRGSLRRRTSVDSQQDRAAEAARERRMRDSQSLIALVNHPSASLILGPAAHQYLAEIAEQIQQEERSETERLDRIARGELAPEDQQALEEAFAPTDTPASSDWRSAGLPTIHDDEEEEESSRRDSFVEAGQNYLLQESADSADGAYRSYSLKTGGGTRMLGRQVSLPHPHEMQPSRLLAPAEVYTVTLSHAPFGFRFFEPATAAQIITLLPSLSKSKIQANSQSLLSTEPKPINVLAVLPIVESVLPGFPADFVPADGTNAVAHPDALAPHAVRDELEAKAATDERARGWKSRGAVAVGDRLLAVNGIRLDILPVASATQELAGLYSDATNRAVKLVKFAMQSLNKLQRSQSDSTIDGSSTTFTAASDRLPDPTAPTCTLTFVSAGPYVRRGVIVGMQLAQQHEASLKAMAAQLAQAMAVQQESERDTSQAPPAAVGESDNDDAVGEGQSGDTSPGELPGEAHMGQSSDAPSMLPGETHAAASAHSVVQEVLHGILDTVAMIDHPEMDLANGRPQMVDGHISLMQEIVHDLVSVVVANAQGIVEDVVPPLQPDPDTLEPAVSVVESPVAAAVTPHLDTAQAVLPHQAAQAAASSPPRQQLVEAPTTIAAQSKPVHNVQSPSSTLSTSMSGGMADFLVPQSPAAPSGKQLSKDTPTVAKGSAKEMPGAIQQPAPPVEARGDCGCLPWGYQKNKRKAAPRL